jgi:hypothetical protein
LTHRQNPHTPSQAENILHHLIIIPTRRSNLQVPRRLHYQEGVNSPTNKHTVPTARHQHPIRQRTFRPSLTSLNTTLLVLGSCLGCIYFEDKCLYCGYICRYLCTAIACARVPASCILLNIGESLSYSCGCDFWSRVVFRWVEGFGSTFTGFCFAGSGPDGEAAGYGCNTGRASHSHTGRLFVGNCSDGWYSGNR